MKPHIVCPHCGNGEGFACEHILNGEYRHFGPWYCGKCGKSIYGQWTPDGIVIEKRDEVKIDTADLLMLRPHDRPVYFIVKGMRFEGGRTAGDRLMAAAASLRGERDVSAVSIASADEEYEHKKFYYESHSCPTNWFEPTTVYFDGDADPHGLIEFVATRDWSSFPQDESGSPNNHDDEMVKFIETHSQMVKS